VLKKKHANKNYISFASRLILEAIEKNKVMTDNTILQLFTYLSLFIIVIVTMLNAIM